MVERALLSAQDRDPDEAGNWGEEDLYRPRYLRADTATIAVPALTFVNLEGTRGLERSYYPLEVAELVASPSKYVRAVESGMARAPDARTSRSVFFSAWMSSKPVHRQGWRRPAVPPGADSASEPVDPRRRDL